MTRAAQTDDAAPPPGSAALRRPGAAPAPRPRAPGSRTASRPARRRRSRPARWRRRRLRLRPRWKVAMLWPLVAEQRAEAADEARLVAVGHVEHVRPELGLHVDALDLDDARLAVGEDRAGDRALLPFGDDGQADVALIGAGLAAARLLDLDAALLGEGRARRPCSPSAAPAAGSRRAPPRSARGRSSPRPRLRIRA